MKTHKKILLISYHFPPGTAVGGLRLSNFARYLSDFGWQTHVLTIDRKYLEKVDDDRLQDLDDVKIHRTFMLPKVFDVLLTMRSKARRMKAAIERHPSGQAHSRKVVQSSCRTDGNERAADRIKRYFNSLFLALPDRERNWVLPAVIKAIQIIRKEKIDWILTSCPPYSVHLIGLAVNLFTGIDWVADFRDPWFAASQKSIYPTCKLSRSIEKAWEGRIMQRARLIVANTAKFAVTLQNTYPGVAPEKFVHISNGIPKAAFCDPEGIRKYDTFTLTYAGSLYLHRTPEPIFKAVGELVDSGVIRENELKIKLVGNCDHINGAPTTKMIAEYGLERCVELLPPLPYRQALEILKKSHLALLFAPDQPYQIPAKAYDYIGTGTRILAIANQGATWELIDATSSGKAFLPTDIDGLKDYITEGVKSASSCGDSGHHAALLERFDYKNITAKLAENLSRASRAASISHHGRI